MQPVSIQQIPVGPMANFSYLIVDKETKKAAYIDPGWEAEKVINFATKEGITIEKILLTHTHFDHIQELEQAYNRLKVPVYVHGIEAGVIEEMGVPVNALADNEKLKVGGLNLDCIHTPGHTPGALCFKVDQHLITGDTLFVDGCGRVDLPGSDPDLMFESLKKLSLLPEETIVYPGHDYGPTPTDTLGHQKKTNPYLSASMQGKDVFFGRRGV
ncbi:MAG: MBL fold metallo-hydrolase [Deltaproteobacteria bacterium]|nr:MBL fold metallo-hydrolase [Deltaproteobacteria bacterium]